jgi:hypothetical protein
MDTPRTRKCPTCGTLVVLPLGDRADGDVPNERRLDQLAQSLCGCWVKDLSDSGLLGLVEAIMSSNGHESRLHAAAGGDG